MRGESKHEMVDLDWQEVAAAVLAARGIKTGLWRFAARLQFAATTVSWRPEDGAESHKPTGLIGIEGLAMMHADAPGPMVFDAATLSRAASPSKRPAAKRARAKP